MKAEQLLALARFDDKEIREEVEAGAYEIDLLVHLHGSISVGEDHEALITAAIPWQRLAAVLFDRLGGSDIESALSEAMGEELDATRIKGAAEAAMQELKGSTLRIRKGAVRTILVAEEIK